MIERRRLILFTRHPKPGRVKTRLIPALGAEDAAALQRRLLLRTFRAALAACSATGAELEVRFDGGDAKAFQNWLGSGFLCRPQGDGDLGQRMARAFADSFTEGLQGTIIIGSDCPLLTSEKLTAAFERLALANVVFGQAYDGGYYLIGLTKMIPELFENIPWGTDRVLAESRRVLATKPLRPAILEPLRDLDVPEDLADWQRLIEAEEGGPQRVSVVIPALNEEESIAATLESVRRGNPHEMIVVDGGSTDETSQHARVAGVAVVECSRGPARQMNAGAARATGNVLLFLHADTLLAEDWPQDAARTLAQDGVAGGAFTFRIAGKFFGRRIIENTANRRARRRQLPYGDQGLFLRRKLFEEMGGFADLPVMEDYEFVRRLRRRGQIVIADSTATTSGRRWKKRGVVRTTVINRLMIVGYHLGFSPRWLAALYGRKGG